MGSFCSSKPQVSTYKPAAEVSAGYKDLLGRAAPLLDRQYPEYAGQLVAGLSPYTTAAGQGIAALGGGTQGAYNMAQGLALAGAAPIQPMQFSGEAVGQYLSPYLQNVMGATAANIAQTNAQQQSQLTGNAIQRGAFGGDRAGIAAAELARQQNLANNATLANIANQGYQSALGMFNQQQLANMQAQLQSGQLAQGAGNLLGNLATGGQQASLAQLGAQLQYGGLEQQQRQAELSTAYQQFLNKQQYPYQQLGWYGGLLGGAAQGMGGTTTTQAAQPSPFNQLLGAGIGLAAMGGTGGLFGGAGLIPGIKSAFGFADGGAVDPDNKYAEGGVVGASPIAGMKAQEFFPEQRQPQSGYQAPRNDTIIDPNAGLGKMVNDIRTLLKPGQSGVAGAGEKSKDNTEGMDTNPPIPMAPPRMAAGGVAPFNFDYGLTTKDDLSQLAESQAGSGYGSMSPQMEAEASSGLIGAAHGGRIHYQEGGVAPAGFDASPYVEKFEPYSRARESGGDPNAKAKTSSASGYWQITDPTFEGIRRANPDITDKNDPRAFRHLATEVATSLNRQGIEPTPQNMHMGWFLGDKTGGAFIKNMQANPDAPAYSLVSPEAVKANQNVFFDNQRPRSAQEVYNFLAREPGAASAAMASVRGQGEPGGARAAVEPRNTATEDYIPYRSKSEKVGLLGMLGVSTTPEERLALMQAGFKLAGTPGRPGVGLAAAADTYAKTLMEARKEQRETAGSQAAGERERAAAKLEKARELKERTLQGATGTVIATEKPDGTIGYEMVKMPLRPGEKTGTQGMQETPAGTAETGAGTNIMPGAGTAPKAPTSPVQNEDEIMREYGEKALQSQFHPQTSEAHRKMFQTELEGASAESKGAVTSMPGIMQTIEAVTKTPESGALVPGAGAAIRYAAANYFNTVFGALGVQTDFNDAITAKQVQDKVATLNAQQQQRGLGREAGFWLQALSKASPNVELNKETSASILANTLVANKISRDRYDVYNKYAAPEYSGGMGYNAQALFERLRPMSGYTTEMNAIKNILLQTKMGEDGKPTSPIYDLMRNPERRNQFDMWAKKNYGVNNLSNYFM
jgi:hypothetical protein